MYKLETGTGIPNILKMRSGHSMPPQKVRFYGGDQIDNNFNNHLLSLSNLEFRNISMINEHMSRDFSLKNIPKDLKHQIKIMGEELNNNFSNKFSDFDYNEFRERDWSNILVKVTNSPWPLLFSYENSSISEFELKDKKLE